MTHFGSTHNDHDVRCDSLEQGNEARGLVDVPDVHTHPDNARRVREKLFRHVCRSSAEHELDDTCCGAQLVHVCSEIPQPE
jgi:hypothetical protein